MKILIVKTSALGDIIHSFPVVDYIKHLFPQSQIDWVVESSFAELVRAHPDIHTVFPVKVKKWRAAPWKKENRVEMRAFCRALRSNEYDVIFDLQGNVKSGCFTGLARGKHKVGFSRSVVPEWPNLLFTNKRYTPPSKQNIRQDYLFLVQSFFNQFLTVQARVKLQTQREEQEKIQHLLTDTRLQRTSRLIVCPGSNWTNKQLTPQCLQEFLMKIHQQTQATFLLVWGNAQEKEMAHRLHQTLPQASVIVEKLSLAGLQSLMHQVEGVIAMDSLPLHLAGTTATPTYAIFGASSAQKYNPLGKGAAFQGGCPYQQTFEKRCALLRTCTTGLCIKGIDPQQLFEHFIQWWQTVESPSINT